LIDLGYPVIEAENGNQAMEMIEQIADIAIVVSDIIMPGGINGRQLAEAGARHPGMRIVLMSGYTDETSQPGPAICLCSPSPLAARIWSAPCSVQPGKQEHERP
jgi:CheY-like chemotaxis protein